MAKSKEPIRLREKAIANGGTSLYLDIYIDGKRTYEFLKLYLVPESTKADKVKNQQTLQLAEAVKAKRIVDHQNGVFGFCSAYKLDTNFLDYYRAICEKKKRKSSAGNWGNWQCCLRYLESFCSEKTTFKDITPGFIERFKKHLEMDLFCHGKKKGLSQNSKASYFNKLRACVNQAFEERIMPHNPLRGIESIKSCETERTYLTIEDVKKLAATTWRFPVLKRAFLFSCLTGMRKSDIEKMTWSEVQKERDYTRVIFKQKKTGAQEYLDISPQAVQYMGEDGKGDDRVFAELKYSSFMAAELRLWAMAAGVTKDVTFHVGRHTFAVMMLDLGVDIYTVSKLLGHTELKTTQIYAKVLDKNKQNAVNMIPDIFPAIDI